MLYKSSKIEINSYSGYIYHPSGIIQKGSGKYDFCDITGFIFISCSNFTYESYYLNPPKTPLYCDSVDI